MATNGMRISIDNIPNGGCIVSQETCSGFGGAAWQERYKEAFGRGQEKGLRALVQEWVGEAISQSVVTPDG